MNQPRTRPVTCAVCGGQTNCHAGWFLVIENRWLDHLKILSWHPVLADQAEMQSVCGQDHLKVLIQHWVTQANLDLQSGKKPVTPILAEYQAMAEPGSPAVGTLLGELAVHRSPQSRVWTGSTQTLECILSALTGREAKPRAVDYSLASFHAGEPEKLAYTHSAGRA